MVVHEAGLHFPPFEIAEAAKVINTARFEYRFWNELSMIFDKLNIPTKDVLRLPQQNGTF